MKMIVAVALALVAVAVALPVEEKVEVISQTDQRLDNGEYIYGTELSDGSKRQEEAKLKQGVDEDNKPVNFLGVRGSYSFVDEQGNIITVEYEADENGYRAFGPSVPKNPENYYSN